jgi:hypothetical protein
MALNVRLQIVMLALKVIASRVWAPLDIPFSINYASIRPDQSYLHRFIRKTIQETSHQISATNTWDLMFLD